MASWVKSGVGAALAMGIIGWIGAVSHEPLLIAPFGASCVLLFAAPSSPLAQPVNVIAGHAAGSALGLLLRMVLPNEWWAIALAVGAVITVMMALRITHPPAGADPVVIFLSDPGWGFLLVPILTGTLVLVGIATLIHMIPPRTTYPLILHNVLKEDQVPIRKSGHSDGASDADGG
ncbi:MAG: HPP family protein [Rhodospirillales bacterium]|nr:HPP family protein [Rhodospirillales bacterium]